MACRDQGLQVVSMIVQTVGGSADERDDHFP